MPTSQMAIEAIGVYSWEKDKTINILHVICDHVPFESSPEQTVIPNWMKFWRFILQAHSKIMF